jgi:hypothetical protein
VRPTEPPGQRVVSQLLHGTSAAVGQNLQRLRMAVDGGISCNGSGSTVPGSFATPSRFRSPQAAATPVDLLRQRHHVSLAVDSVLGDLYRCLIEPVVTLLPTPAAATAALGTDAPHVAFITMWQRVEVSSETGAAVSDGSIGVVPFPALLQPAADDVSAPSPSDHRLIDDYAVSVSPSVASFLLARTAEHTASVRALVQGGASRMHRPPWLSAEAARTLNVRGQRGRGAEEIARWTVLADSSAPAASSGISADLFIGVTGSAGAHGAFVASTISSAVVTLWGPGAAADLGDSTTDTDVDSIDAGMLVDPAEAAERTVARAFAIGVVRHLVDELSTSTTSLTVASAFRHALLATRAEHLRGGRRLPSVSWAPMVLLHGGGRLDSLRMHVRGLREEAETRLSSARARISVRGPLSTAESRNVRYVQDHDIPALFDVMCRELLLSRPSEPLGVLDSLIGVLTSMPPPSRPSQPRVSSGASQGCEDDSGGANPAVPNPPNRV